MSCHEHCDAPSAWNNYSKGKRSKKCGRGLMATRPRYRPPHNIAVKKRNKKALQYYIYTCIYRLPHESCFSVSASKLKFKGSALFIQYSFFYTVEYIFELILSLKHKSSLPSNKFDYSRSNLYQLAKWSNQEDKVAITTNQSLTFKNLTNFFLNFPCFTSSIPVWISIT